MLMPLRLINKKFDYKIPANLSNVLNLREKPIKEWLKPFPGESLTFTTVHTASGENYTMVP